MADQVEPYSVALLAGSMAGLSVDLALFPLDTIKTRLQSSEGFIKSGGFRGIYAGLGSTAVGSMPGAALFFCTYEAVKSRSRRHVPQHLLFTTHMFAASCGEVAACVVRVPTEVVKQRAQTLRVASATILGTTLKQEGFSGLYRGYFSTVLREIPFSLIQFPLWEFFKITWQNHQSGPLQAWQSSVCGAAAGAISAGCTTPLDVAKTRIMLAQKSSVLAQGGTVVALQHVYREKGVPGLFAGLLPRMMWISIGGAIFLGIYDKAKTVIKSWQQNNDEGR